MTYIGSMKDADAMSDEKRIEQERIQGFDPEGVEDFAVKWFGAIDPVVPVMSVTPYLAVPRSAPTADARRIAALEAELAAARAALTAAATQARELTGQTAKAAPAPLAGALRAWSGYGGIDQLTGKPSWA